MITQTSAVRLRQNLGEILDQVQYRHDSIVISRDGKPAAVAAERHAVTNPLANAES